MRRDSDTLLKVQDKVISSLWADGPLDWKLVEALIEQSYRQVALKRMLSRLDGKAGAA
ncbi:MAG TPA: hypothetical protein VMR74_02665 [Gammaproteobacteria bacterium]|nr:hypothetical protein [Gammaproteobacteria bacterium]